MILKLENNINIENSFEVKKNIIDKLSELDGYEDNTLILDFNKIDFMDSTGLGILVSILKRSRSKNIDLKIINISERVYEVFEVTMLDEIFNLEKK